MKGFGRLLKNEYIRLFCNYKVIPVLLLFLAGNALLLYFHAERDRVDPAAYREVKETLSSMTDGEKGIWFAENFSGENTPAEVSQMAEEYDRAYTYPAYLQKIQDEADKNVSISIFSKSRFSLNNIKKTAEDFRKLEETEVRCIGGYGISFVLSFRGTDILLFMLTALLIAAVLLEDKRSGMLAMMRATRYGGGSFALAKGIVVSSVSFFLACCFRLENILEALFLYGEVPLTESLQSLPGFDKCSYEWTVGQGLLLSTLLACMAFSFVSLVLFLAAALADNYVPYYLGISLFFSIEYGMFYIGERLDSLAILKRFNVFSLIDAQTCTGYYNYNLFGQPVHMLPVNVTGILILSAVLLVSGIYVFAGHGYDYREFSFGRGKKRLQPGYGIWNNEAYKLFIGNRVLFLLVALFLLQAYLYQGKTAHWYEDEICYRYYISRVAGAATDDKYAYMDGERERLAGVQAEYQAYDEMFYKGEISYEQYSLDIRDLEPELEKINGFNMADRYVSYIRELDDPDKGIVYDRGFAFLAGGRDYSNDIHNGIVIMLFVILALSGVMSQEERYHMNALIGTSRHAERSGAVKLAVSFLTTCLLYLMVYLPELLWVLREYGGAGAGYSVHSVFLLSDVGLSCSIRTYIILVNLVRFLMIQMAGALIVFSGKLIKNHNAIIIAALMIFVMPLLLRLLGIEVIDSFSLNRFLSGNMVFR